MVLDRTLTAQGQIKRSEGLDNTVFLSLEYIKRIGNYCCGSEPSASLLEDRGRASGAGVGGIKMACRQHADSINHARSRQTTDL